MPPKPATALEGEPAGPSPEDRQEFRTLTTLLSALTALSRSDLQPLLPEAPDERYHGPLELSQTKMSLVLNAFASLIVRNHEIVAVAASLPSPPPPSSPSANTDNDDNFNVIAMDQDQVVQAEKQDPLDFTEINFQNIQPTDFTAIANPRPENNPPNSDIHCTSPAGNSHWGSILKNQFFGLGLP